MKDFTKIVILQFLFFVVLCGSSFADYPVSGTVRYSDNQDIVTNGLVKAYNMSCVLVAVTTINPDGTYMFSGLPQEYVDIIGFPNTEWEDFVPTYYPDEIDWQYAVSVYPDQPLTGIDLYVERLPGGDYPFASFIEGSVKLNNSPVKDAIVYAKAGKVYAGFGITDEKGEYVIDPLPAGDYVLIVHRMGYNSIIRNVSLTENGLSGINFTLESGSRNLNMISSNPKEFKLSQNYPNPFNPVTRIDYVLPSSVSVKISVFNALGEVVKELVNGFQTSGSYTIEFDGLSLSSGVYYYRIDADGFTETRKMLLVK